MLVLHHVERVEAISPPLTQRCPKGSCQYDVACFYHHLGTLRWRTRSSACNRSSSNCRARTSVLDRSSGRIVERQWSVSRAAGSGKVKSSRRLRTASRKAVGVSVHRSPEAHVSERIRALDDDELSSIESVWPVDVVRHCFTQACVAGVVTVGRPHISFVKRCRRHCWSLSQTSIEVGQGDNWSCHCCQAVSFSLTVWCQVRSAVCMLSWECLISSGFDYFAAFNTEPVVRILFTCF